MRGGATGAFIALAAAILAAPQRPAVAADLDDLPPEVREKTQPVHLNWSKQLDRTLEGALHLKGIHLPGRADAPAGTPIDAVHLGAVQAPAQLPVAEVGGSALSEAVQSLLVGLLVQGTTSAEGWQQQIEANGLTVADICRVWRRFRREHPRKGERFGVASSLWAAIGVVVPVDQRNPADLPLDDAFSLGEVQLWGSDGETAQQTFEALLERLPEGPTTGRVSRGLLAYRIAQCRQQASDLEGALDWFLKCAEWGTPEMTGGYDVRGEGLVMAARMYRKLGRHEEARAAYERAIGEGTQWGQVVASSDWAHVLRSSGRMEEARALLEDIAGQNADNWAAGVLFDVLAHWAFEDGDLRQALGYCEQGGGQVDGVASPLARGVRRSLLRLAERIDRWTREPIQFAPSKLELTAVAGTQGPVGDLRVTTWRQPDVTVTSDPAILDARLAGATARRPGEWTRRYELYLLPNCPPGSHEARIVVIGPAGASAHIPLRLTVEHPIRTIPTEVFLGFVRPGADVSVAVLLRADASFRITGVVADSEIIDVGQPEPISAKEHLLNVKCRPEGTRPSGRQESQIEIRTNLSDAPVRILAAWHIVHAE